MTNLFTTTFLFLLIACRESNTVSTILHPDTKDINDIIEIIVIQDSLPFSNTEIMSPSPLLIELRKIQVIVPSIKEEAPSPDDDTTISIFYLLNSLINNQKFFDQTDSSLLLSQNNSIKSFSLNKTVKKLEIEITLSADILKSYTGVYKPSPASKGKKIPTITIYLENGSLYADLSNGTGRHMLLAAQTETRFSLPDVQRIKTFFEFVKENGKTIKLIATQEKATEFIKTE